MSRFQTCVALSLHTCLKTKFFLCFFLSDDCPNGFLYFGIELIHTFKELNTFVFTFSNKSKSLLFSKINRYQSSFVYVFLYFFENQINFKRKQQQWNIRTFDQYYHLEEMKIGPRFCVSVFFAFLFVPKEWCFSWLVVM